MVKFIVSETFPSNSEFVIGGGHGPAGILETRGLMHCPSWAGRPVTAEINEVMYNIEGDRWVACFLCRCPKCDPDEYDADAHEQLAPHSRGCLVSPSEARQWFGRQGIDLPESLRNLASGEVKATGAPEANGQTSSDDDGGQAQAAQGIPERQDSVAAPKKIITGALGYDPREFEIKFPGALTSDSNKRWRVDLSRFPQVDQDKMVSAIDAWIARPPKKKSVKSEK